MRQSHYSASHRADASGQLSERVIAFLRARHPSKTPAHVAAETGVPAGTVQKWLDRGSAPSVWRFTQLWLAYGPEFLAATVERAPAWLDREVRAQQADELKRLRASIDAKLARLSA